MKRSMKSTEDTAPHSSANRYTNVYRGTQVIYNNNKAGMKTEHEQQRSLPWRRPLLVQNLAIEAREKSGLFWSVADQ